MVSDGQVVEAVDVWRMYTEDQGVRALDLTVPAGTIYGLVGPSGSGKTTTVRLLLGNETPQHGTIRVLGQPPESFSRADRGRIGYLPQLPALAPELTLRHNLQLVASLYGLPWRLRGLPGRRHAAARRRVAEVLEFVGLTDEQRTRLRDASGGEQRRLALAAAVVHEPDLLVLDEPTAGIDPLLRRRIWKGLVALRDTGTTIVVTTQYVTEAENCDLVTLLVEGRALVTDTPQRLRRRAFGDDHDNGAPFDDVFVALLRRYEAESDDEVEHA